jgi:hypothetical protein
MASRKLEIDDILATAYPDQYPAKVRDEDRTAKPNIASTSRAPALNEPVGTDNEDLGSRLLRQVVDTMPPGAGKKDPERDQNFALRLLREIGSRDPIEAMLTAQMVGIHHVAMELLALASPPNADLLLAERRLNQCVKLFRIFPAQMGALNRHREKVSQQEVDVPLKAALRLWDRRSHRGSGKVSTANDEKKIG